LFEVTLPAQVHARLKHLYSRKSLILEYGSGGSTIMALSENPENIVYSCETDPVWLCKLCGEITRLGYSSRFHPVYLDIGCTGEWGHPDFVLEPFTASRGQKMINTAFIPWRILQHEKVSPDVILIDGRFRVAAFIASALNINKKTTVVFDDYVGRAQYHCVESIAMPSETVDRAAIFELTPQQYLARDILNRFSGLLINPN